MFAIPMSWSDRNRRKQQELHPKTGMPETAPPRHGRVEQAERVKAAFMSEIRATTAGFPIAIPRWFQSGLTPDFSRRLYDNQ